MASAKSKTYGDDNPTLDAVVTGTVNGDALSYTLATTAVKFSGVGSYPIAVTLGSNPNYSVTSTNAVLTIGQKIASVTADAKSKTYGDANPALTAVVVGQVSGGDAINYTLATTASQFSNVGTYPIAVTLGVNPNYSVTYNNSTLTINTRPTTITATPGQYKYCGQGDPTFAYTYTSSSLSQGLAVSDAFSGALTRVSGQGTGFYNILLTGLTIKNGATDVSSNYSISYTGSTFEIKSVSIDASASGTAIQLGTPNNMRIEESPSKSN